MMTVGVYATDLDIHNIMRLQLPNNWRIVSVNQSLGRDFMDKLYWLTLSIRFTYENKYSTLDIYLYGEGNDSQFSNTASLVKKDPNIRKGVSLRALQPYEEMKKAFAADPRKTGSGLAFSKFSRNVPVDNTEDCFFYFPLDNPYFYEAIIETKNIWNTEKTGTAVFKDKKIMNIVQIPSRESTMFTESMDLMMESVVFPEEKAAIVFNPSLAFKSGDLLEGYYIAVEDNVRLRKKPEMQSDYIENMLHAPYMVVAAGPEVIMDGKKGRWLGISLEPGETFGWVFSEAVRKLKESELDQYFNGR